METFMSVWLLVAEMLLLLLECRFNLIQSVYSVVTLSKHTQTFSLARVVVVVVISHSKNLLSSFFFLFLFPSSKQTQRLLSLLPDVSLVIV